MSAVPTMDETRLPPEALRAREWASKVRAIDLLATVIADRIGPDARPRKAQRLLCASVDERMRAAEALAGRPAETLERDEIAACRSATVAPVGSGKSFAYLCAAALAALRGHRTVVSTESISLQSQLADKDAPAVAETVERLTGAHVRAAVVKGQTNYVCFHTAEDSLLGLAEQAGVRAGPDDLISAPALKRLTNQIAASLPDEGDATSARLVGWALGRSFVADDPGDRASCPYEVDDRQWWLVSTRFCPGKPDDERLCGHLRAKALGRSADIVITNHSMLAVQATRGIPTVFGTPALGPFRHLVVDEAHRLPDVVREQGRRELAPGRLRALSRAVSADDLLSDQFMKAAAVAEATARDLHTSHERQSVIAADDEDIQSLLSGLDQLLELSRKRLGEGASREAMRALDDLGDVLRSFPDPDEPPERAVRWSDGESLFVSPVEVGGLMAGHLYAVGPTQEVLSVNCVSGTLPPDFTGEAGLGGRITTHESPFTDAYARSEAVIIRPSAEDWSSLKRAGRLDLEAHRAWAREQIVKAVADNGGATLVLAATKASGREYAEALRTALEGTDITVYTQWDGLGLGELVRRFRQNTSSVLVGVRSLMTGTDVPGDALTQVIIDRVPRAAGNVVDDARVRAKERAGMKRHQASQAVYTTAASLLLTQAVGRLIRSADDTGRVLLLDPRLDASAEVAYPTATRRTYLRSVREFGRVRTVDA